MEHTHFRDEKQGVADIFKKKGPFLKLFSSYILNFENITSTFDEALKKYPAFQAAVREFEVILHYIHYMRCLDGQKWSATVLS